MARVFISHSSRDAILATRIKDWLQGQGFDTPFLDFDKHAGIAPGADWEKTLYREIERSEAMVIIQTPNWLDSKWCFAEFTQARALGKPIFPIIETPTGDTLIAPDIQALNLLKDREGGLKQLSSQLTQIALDTQGGFSWDVNRSPYPGMLTFAEEDAAVYFGRDDDIRRLIERLNVRRAQGGNKLLVVLGASGAGKSSLLRAGVIPRIRRARHNWIVLPTIRPQTHPVDELARSICIARRNDSDWQTCRTMLTGPDRIKDLGDIASDLRIQAGANEAQILLPIDQAEELFGAADANEASQFFQIVTAITASELPFIVVMTMRSDYLGNLQCSDHLSVRFEEFSLTPLPLSRYGQIIEGPARVAGIGIDKALVQQAIQDAKTEDALPLLAFALRELYDGASGDHYLSLDEYRALGAPEEKLTPLENAVRKAADEVLDEIRPPDDQLAALRNAFVPAMVEINDKGDYVRRPARWSELPAQSYPLLERLAKARLLIIRQENDERIVEVAHEALLRKWPRLRAWLDDARDFLNGRQQLERDLHDWENAADELKKETLLTGLKLNRARHWLEERPHQLTAKQRQFAQASIDFADRQAKKRATIRALITWSSVTVSVILAATLAFALHKQAELLAAQEKLQMLYLEALGSMSIGEVIYADGVPGHISLTGQEASWTALMETKGLTFAAARNYKAGRVLAVGHDGVLSDAVAKRFIKIAFEWLNGSNGKRSILYTSGHCEVFPNWLRVDNKNKLNNMLGGFGYQLNTHFDAIDHETLNDVDILIIGNAWGNLANDEIQMIEKFVKDGGGLFVAGLGWSWKEYSDKPGFACSGSNQAQNSFDMSIYPMNKVVAPYGMQWTDQIIDLNASEICPAP